MTKTGKDADGIAKTEADHHMKCPVAGNGSTCAISVRSPSMSTTTARLKYRKLRAAAARWLGAVASKIRRVTKGAHAAAQVDHRTDCPRSMWRTILSIALIGSIDRAARRGAVEVLARGPVPLAGPRAFSRSRNDT